MLGPKDKHEKHISTSPHLIKRPFKNQEYREHRLHKPNDKTKKGSEATGKGSVERNLLLSQNKKRKVEKKKMKGSNILECTENQTFFDLEHQYHKELNEQGQEVKWLVPKEDGLEHSFTTFPEFISESDFQNLNNLKLNFLHYVCKRRIIRDDDFEFIYEGMLIKFPSREAEIKQIMAEVLAVLDS